MNSIQPSFIPENTYWLTGQVPNAFYLYVELNGVEATKSSSRVPLNLSLVIDRSGSMGGEKIEFAKQAAKFVVDNLNSDDKLSIVQYDNVVDVVAPSGNVLNKTDLHRRINQIEARNTTNLSGGLLQGYQEVTQTKQQGQVNRVLLLSDGLANEGITDPEQLNQLAQNKFREEGIALSTFGVGADFNELLMTSLSEFGGANYYFIETPDKIPAIFARELQGLLAIVAQNAVAEITVPEHLFACTKVFGYPAQILGNRIRIPFNDFFSKEKKAVLIQLKPLAAPDADFQFGFSLNYTNAIGVLNQVEVRSAITIPLSTDPELVASSINTSVREQILLFTLNALYEEAINLMETRHKEDARQRLTEILAEIDTYLKAHEASWEIQRLRAQIEQFLNQVDLFEEMSMERKSVHLKISRNAMYSMEKKRDY